MAAFSWLVRPLEETYKARLDALAQRHALPTSRDAAGLGEAVKRLSDLYNRRGTAEPEAPVAEASRAHLGARLGFSFVRDVPKGAAAVRELVGVGLLGLGEAPLRVLDFGAGLGAMTHGLARALGAANGRGTIEALFTDSDPRVLALARELASTTTEDPVRIVARTESVHAGARIPRGPFDVILVGQVLSELDEHSEETARRTAHLALLDALFAELAPEGSLVVVEPALRDRSRHLHAIRDAWVARGQAPFAPCLHAGACPALIREDDWCHEDLAVDLPTWLVPVARAAGLRYQGLSFSYLVLRKDGKTLASALPTARLRVVSELLRSKGKAEAFVCGAFPDGPKKERLRRLDRHASASNASWDRLSRGDLLDLELPVEGVRIEPDARVELVPEAP